LTDPTTSTRLRLTLLLAVGIALVPFVLLVWRFNFVYDDAYISFRYARNLAEGLGLRFNMGVDPPVEGYTNFLWTLWIAALESVKASPPVWSRISSFGCALVLFWSVVRFASLEFRLSSLGTICTALFFGTLPPLAVWATSGLETMPFALAVFLTYDRIAPRHREPSWILSGLAAVAAALLRADGLVYVGIVLFVVAVRSLRDKERGRLRATFQAGALALLATAGHVAWRYAYYHALVPNTASVKVSASSLALAQGRNYVLEVLMAVPSIGLVLLVALGLQAAKRRPDASPLFVSLGMLAYVIVVGGDFMTFGRFIVPALPFVCLMAGQQVHYLETLANRRGLVLAVWMALMVGLSLPAAFDIHLVPEAARARYRVARFNKRNTSQYKLWTVQKKNTEKKVILGKALGRHTQPGESFVRAAIGAVGYYSGLFIYDRFGLVTREVGTREVTDKERGARRLPPGHQKAVGEYFFQAQRPTYVRAGLVAEQGTPNDKCGSTWGYHVRCEYYPLEPDLATDELRFLQLARAVYDDR